MLESCSQDSFTQKGLVKELQQSGKRKTLNQKTLNGERTEPTMLIEGADVKGVSGNNFQKFIPGQSCPLTKSITQTDGIKVGLLIGADFMKG